MQRRLLGYTSILTTSTVLCFSERKYYNKIRQVREGSDDGPAEMFHEFPKSASPNHVPEELRNVSAEAVGDADRMQAWFLLSSSVLVLLLFSSSFMDPFGEGYHRPEGYAMHSTEAKSSHARS